MTQTDADPERAAQTARFSKALVGLMNKRGVSASDVARAIWGKTVDARGRDVARNRDRISQYVLGKQIPTTGTLRKLADFFNVDVSAFALYPQAAETTGAGAGDGGYGTNGRVPPAPSVSLTTIGSRPDLVLVRLEKMLPMKTALRILELAEGASPE